MSPDWAAQAEPVPYAKLDDPQSLNLYSYVTNNPLNHVDPDGHCDMGFESSHCGAGSLMDAWKSDMATWNAGQQPSDMGSWLDDPNFDRSDGMRRTEYDYNWTGGDGSKTDKAKQRDAEILGNKAAGTTDPAALQEAIQTIYDGLTPSARYEEKGRAEGLHGGNFNFDQQIGSINILELGYHTGRNGVMPSVHIESENHFNFFHIDAANGSSIAGPVHWIWDVFLGTYVFKNGLPQ